MARHIFTSPDEPYIGVHEIEGTTSVLKKDESDDLEKWIEEYTISLGSDRVFFDDSIFGKISTSIIEQKPLLPKLHEKFSYRRKVEIDFASNWRHDLPRTLIGALRNRGYEANST